MHFFAEEQLDSVIPFLSGEEKFWAAHDIISAHVLASSDEVNEGDANDSYLIMFFYIFSL